MKKASISASRSGDFLSGGLVGFVLMAVSFPLVTLTLWIFIGGFIALASLGVVAALVALKSRQKRPYWAIGIACGYFVPPLTGASLIYTGARYELQRLQTLSSNAIAKPTRSHSVIDLSGVEHNDTLFRHIALARDVTVVLPLRDGRQVEMIAATGATCNEDDQIVETLQLIGQGVFDRCILRRPAQPSVHALVIRDFGEAAERRQSSWKNVRMLEAVERISGAEFVLVRSVQGYMFPSGQFTFPSEIEKQGVAALLNLLLEIDATNEFATLQERDSARALRLSLPWLGHRRTDVRRVASQVFESALNERRSEFRKAALAAGQRPAEVPGWAAFRTELLGMADQLTSGSHSEQRHQAQAIRQLLDQSER